MSNRRLYTVTVPESALQRQSGQANQRQQLQKLVGLQGDGSVNQVGSNPGEFRLEGQYKGTGAELLAREISELAGSEAISSVALYDDTTSVASAGYYTAEQIDNRRFRPQKPEVSSFSVRLTREGTRDSHYRYLRTNRRQVSIGAFGSDATERIAIPDAATRVYWVSEDKTQYAAASSVGTLTGEEGDVVALYNITDAPSGYGSAALAYQLAYADAGNVDAAVFDTYGNSEFDGDGNFRWQQVFQSSHEVEGKLVFENGLVRLFVDADANTLSAEEWDTGSSAWVSRSLGTANGWQVFDVDLVSADPARVYAQFTFEDSDDGSLYSLDAFLHRGWQNVQFAIPETASGPIPADLVTYLDPIASGRYTDPRSDAGIIDREVLRQ
jgi:hypothetical protein